VWRHLYILRELGCSRNSKLEADTKRALLGIVPRHISGENKLD